MKYDGRIFDNHFHLNPRSDFISAARVFKAAGGTTINLTNLPMHDEPRGYYRRIYEDTIRMANIVRAEVGLEVLVTIGPYPFDYFFFQSAGYDPMDAMIAGFDLAGEYAKKGLADAIGEVGLPHVAVEGVTLEEFWKMLDYAMKTASDAGVPVVMHTYDLSCEDYNRIEGLARSNGVNAVKHHARPHDMACQTRVFRSIPANRKDLREALKISRHFMLETDFINDPADPNRYLPADSVPKRAQMISQEYEEAEEILSSIFEKVPSEVYGKMKDPFKGYHQ